MNAEGWTMADERRRMGRSAYIRLSVPLSLHAARPHVLTVRRLVQPRMHTDGLTSAPEPAK